MESQKRTLILCQCDSSMKLDGKMAKESVEADSVIEYNPSNDSFELSLGRKCLVKEGVRAQACISYGIRKDSELLLNYGFLRGVAIDGTTDEIRQRLALEFVNRN